MRVETFTAVFLDFVFRAATLVAGLADTFTATLVALDTLALAVLAALIRFAGAFIPSSPHKRLIYGNEVRRKLSSGSLHCVLRFLTCGAIHPSLDYS